MPQQLLPFVPASELAGVLAGSFQDTTVKVADALREEAHSLFGGRTAQVLGVFPDAVVVLAEGGDVLRIRYEKGTTGAVYFTGSEVLPVTVVTQKNVRRFVQNEARTAADLFIRGLTAQANEKVSALAPLVDALNVMSDEEVLQSFSESRSAHQWHALIEERHQYIQPLLEGETLPEPLSPKFSRLYDGSTKPAELSGFEALVTDDVEHLISRLVAVESQAAAALQTARTVREQAAREGGEEVVATLEAFAADLLADVTKVREFVVEASTEFGRVDRIAKVFDSIASEVASFEVAGAFAAKMAARLS
jgi:hypothetical protein